VDEKGKEINKDRDTVRKERTKLREKEK